MQIEKIAMKYTFLLSILIISFSSLASSEKGKKEKKGNLLICVEGIKKMEGNVGILVFNKKEGFPDNEKHAIINKKVKVDSLQMNISLENLPYGEYAIALVHDVNANREFDKNIIGIPKEPFGFSKNKSIYKGLPDFNEASIRLDQEHLKVPIQLISLFSL